jgi:hypothetical protein
VFIVTLLARFYTDDARSNSGFCDKTLERRIFRDRHLYPAWDFGKQVWRICPQMFAYVNCQVRDILVYWMIDPEFTPNCPVIVFLEPTAQIVSDANLDPVMVRCNGYACIDDYYWEWVEYNQIFPS